MTLEDRIKALPSIKDEAGAECVSREVVLGLVAGAKHPDFDVIMQAHQRLRTLARKLTFAKGDDEIAQASHDVRMFLWEETWQEAAPLSDEACDRLLKDIDEDESKLSALIGTVLTHWEQLPNDVKGELGPLHTALIALWNHMECK